MHFFHSDAANDTCIHTPSVIVIVKTICNAHKVNAKHRIGGAGRVTRWPEQSLVKSSIKIKSF